MAERIANIVIYERVTQNSSSPEELTARAAGFSFLTVLYGGPLGQASNIGSFVAFCWVLEHV